MPCECHFLAVLGPRHGDMCHLYLRRLADGLTAAVGVLGHVFLVAQGPASWTQRRVGPSALPVLCDLTWNCNVTTT